MPNNSAPWRTSNAYWANTSGSNGKYGNGSYGSYYSSAQASREERRHQERVQELRHLMASRPVQSRPTALSWASVVAAPPSSTPVTLPPTTPAPKKIYTPEEIVAKRENAKGLKDVRKLLQATDDPEDQAILTECVERLQAKARGRQPPQERLEAALVAMADANTRLTRAQKHLVEARNLHLRATEAAETAKQELEAAEQAEEDRRKQEEEEAERRKREAEEASAPSSSVPTSAGTTGLHTPS